LKADTRKCRHLARAGNLGIVNDEIMATFSKYFKIFGLIPKKEYKHLMEHRSAINILEGKQKKN
jgi:hypothetical protein